MPPLALALLLTTQTATPAPTAALADCPPPPPEAKSCVVRVVQDRAGALTEPPALVTSSGDPAVDAECLERARTKRRGRVPDVFAVPFVENDVHWVAAGAPAPGECHAGGLTRDEIQRPVTAAMPSLKACYERALERDARITGTVTMQWVIDGTGAVAAAAATTKLDDRIMQDCLVAIVRQLRFVPPKGEGLVFVTYPFVFTSSVAPPPDAVAPAKEPPQSWLGCFGPKAPSTGS